MMRAPRRIDAGRLVSLFLLAATTTCRDIVPPQPTAARVTARSALAAPVTFYGPEQFTRGKGKPFTETRTIATAGFQAPFTLHVRNGNPDGTNRVSSGTVALDGVDVLSPADFNQQAAGWDLSVALGASATLTVTLASAPNSFIEISIEGTPAAIVFCPTGGPGIYTDLQAAINASSPNGTILVCDGEWNIPEAHVNRPLTIRSQNPGGATLGDTISSGGGQGSPPALWIDSVTSGTVRLVDIGFAMRGRGVVVGINNTTLGSFDRVEVDSVWFIGRNTTNAFGIVTWYSSVPGAITEITNVHCMHVNICVFAVGATPTNVRRSRFDSSAVLYSTSGAGGVHYGLGTTEDNEFLQCTRTIGPCIQVFSVEGAVTIRRNKITQIAAIPGQSQGPITVSRGNISAGSPHGIVIIEDNEIISHPTGGPPATPAGWQVVAGITISESITAAPVTHQVRRNRIVDAFAGFHFVNGVSATVDAMDNTVVGGVLAFQHGLNLVLNYHRNDLIGALGSFFGLAGAVASNYSCNWWGSASGPVTPPLAVPAARYTPFSVVPIANQPSVVCP